VERPARAAWDLEAARTQQRTGDPAHLADLPRVGEAPRPADRVRFGGVAARPAFRADEGPRSSETRTRRSRRSEGGPPEEVLYAPANVGQETVVTPIGTGSATSEPDTEQQPSASEQAELRPLLRPAQIGARIRMEQVDVTVHGLDAFVQVKLAGDGVPAVGSAAGPAVDSYVQRLCAVATAAALDELLVDGSTGLPRGRCFVEHTAVVPFGSCEVAVVVLLVMSGGWVEQLAGSALIAGDARQAMARATLVAANRRLESLLP
jgi:hypothetical protein